MQRLLELDPVEDHDGGERVNAEVTGRACCFPTITEPDKTVAELSEMSELGQSDPWPSAGMERAGAVRAATPSKAGSQTWPRLRVVQRLTCASLALGLGGSPYGPGDWGQSGPLLRVLAT